MLDPVLRDRIFEAIRKARTYIALMDDPTQKQVKTQIVNEMETIFASIVKNDWDCPPELLTEVDKALKGIEDTYNKIASN